MPGLEPLRDTTRPGAPAWLVLAADGPAADLSAVAPLRNVHVARDPAEFRALLLGGDPRLVVCSEPPAGQADLELVARERQRRPSMRIVHVSAAPDVAARLAALQNGFDEALSAAITAPEMMGRLAILDAKAQPAGGDRQRLRFGDGLELDVQAHELRRHGRPVHLRPKEFGLLLLLANNPGRVWTRDELLERVWGAAAAADPEDRASRTVDVHMRWLRSKIEADPDQPSCLVTVRGVGYRLDSAAR